MTPPPPRASLRLALLLALPATLAAQSSPSAPADSAAAAPHDDVVELSPFSVTSSGDKGYAAQSSLAGTRIKANLMDIGTPISAFTEQFFRDTAITDTGDLARYEISTEYDYAEDAAANMNSVKGDSPPVRVRGIMLSNQAASPSVNFFRVDGRLDTFSIERLDQARGPNSILFGIGTAAGTVNVTTKRARLDRDAGEVDVAGKSWGGLREMVDYNQVLIPNRLAVRVAAVQDGQNSWRNYEYNNNERYFGTIKLKLDAKTELNVEGEHGHVDKATKRTWTAYDAYTPWRNAGGPISAKATTGVQVLSSTPYIVYDTASGTVMNWKGETTSAKSTAADGTALVMTDFNVLPKETAIYGPSFNQLKDYTRTTAILTHEFTPHLNVELSVFRNDNLTHDYDPQLAAGLALQVDTNPTLPNGQANPHAGQAYLEGLPQLNLTDTRDDSARGIIAYDHDFGKIFGQHTLAGLFQYTHENYGQWVTREQILTNPLSVAQPENNANRVFRRTYVNLNGPSDQIVMADPGFMPTITGKADAATGTVYGSAWIPFNSNTQINSNRESDYTAALQSAFLNQRIHTVIGVSRDFRTDYYSTQVRAPLAPFTTGVLTPLAATFPFENTAQSVTFNAVGRVFDWMAVTYSHARNKGVPNPIGTLDNGTGHPPAPEGQSEDIGLKFDLFEHKYFASISHFTSGDKHDFDFTGVLAATINPIWNALDTAGVLAANGTSIDKVLDKTNGSTRDTDSKGWEFEFVANPTDHWRIYANYTNNQTNVSNIGPEMQAYVAAHLPFWQKYAATPISDTTTTAKTVGDQITIINNALFQQFVLVNGREPLGQVRNKWNVLTDYDLPGEFWKGFTVGGGARFLGENLIAYTLTSDAGGNVTRTPHYGSDQLFVDVNAGYSHKLNLIGHSIRWSIQLNLNNVLNNHAFVLLRESDSGQVENYKFNVPIQWILTNRFEF